MIPYGNTRDLLSGKWRIHSKLYASHVLEHESDNDRVRGFPNSYIYKVSIIFTEMLIKMIEKPESIPKTDLDPSDSNFYN